jgi:hypothetical protein
MAARQLIIHPQQSERVKWIGNMATSVTLRQEKVILASGYQVESVVIAAEPTTLFPVFLVTEGLDPWDEEYGGVADLTDLANYVENALVRFTAATAGKFNAISAIPGDVLIVDNALAQVPEWFSTNFTTAKFTVLSVDATGNFILVQSSKPFPTAAASLNWTLKDSTETTTRGNENAGYSSREDETVDTYLRRHFTSLLANVSKAESRVSAIKAEVQSLVNGSKTHGTTFEGIETDTFS